MLEVPEDRSAAHTQRSGKPAPIGGDAQCRGALGALVSSRSVLAGLKILFVSDYSVPRGGNEVVTLGLRDALRERGHDARLFASDAATQPGAGGADYRCFGTFSPLRAALWPVNPSAVWMLRRALADFRPDVVHVRLFLSQLSPGILPLLRDVPALLHEGWYRTVCPVGTRVLPDGSPCGQPAGAICYHGGCVPGLAWPLAMTQLRLWRRWRDVFDVVVANSRGVAEQLTASGIPRVEVIRNGVPLRNARPPLASPPTLAFAGRLVPEKGVDTLLAAFCALRSERPEVKLLIAGDGPDRRRLERSVAALGGDVTFLGHLPREELERRLDPVWAQVVPSRGREAFGNVAAEAMARGTAVVASAVDGLSEYIEPERTGLLVPPEDPVALCAALRRVVDDRAFAESLGAAARRFARREFDPSRFVDRFEAVYERMA